MSTQLSNSAFKTKAGSVPNVANVLPEPGAVILSEHDGEMYFADRYGWNKGAARVSPIQYFATYTDDQVRLSIDIPVGSTVVVNWGDGTTTEIIGDAGVNPPIYSNYADYGTYFITMTGDVFDITVLSVSPDGTGVDPIVTGSINGFGLLPLLFSTNFADQPFYGDIKYLVKDAAVTYNHFFNNAVGLTGDIALFAGKDINTCQFSGTNISGDISKVATSFTGSCINAGTNITFDTIVNWTAAGTTILQDCNWTTKMVDNCLISLANGTTTGKTLRLGGNNGKRSPASDAAFTQLDAANTLLVNSY